MNNRFKALAVAGLLALSAPMLAKGDIPETTKIHTVEVGDTLTGISYYYYDTVTFYDELGVLNGYTNFNEIYIGDMLLIPPAEILIELGKITKDEYGCLPIDFENPDDLSFRYYELKEGDTFNGTYDLIYGGIFENYSNLDYHVTAVELRKALEMFNPIDDPNDLKAGSKIYLLNNNDLVNLTISLKNEGRLTEKTR